MSITSGMHSGKLSYLWAVARCVSPADLSLLPASCFWNIGLVQGQKTSRQDANKTPSTFKSQGKNEQHELNPRKDRPKSVGFSTCGKIICLRTFLWPRKAPASWAKAKVKLRRAGCCWSLGRNIAGCVCVRFFRFWDGKEGYLNCLVFVCFIVWFLCLVGLIVSVGMLFWFQKVHSGWEHKPKSNMNNFLPGRLSTCCEVPHTGPHSFGFYKQIGGLCGSSILHWCHSERTSKELPLWSGSWAFLDGVG